MRKRTCIIYKFVFGLLYPDSSVFHHEPFVMVGKKPDCIMHLSIGKGSAYTPGLLASPLHFWMPEFVTGRLREGFRYFGKVSKGFLTNEALMIGVETRTSSPVRILRDKESLQHITVKGLFPCGEGAGYAGGIVSAAIDGERCAESVAAMIR